MTLARWHWHIEISSKCALRCPRCARQEVPEGLVNAELDLNFFQRNFSPEFIQAHVRKLTFCGDDGDPIYAHDLIPVIAWFKSIKSDIEIVIVTNGSYKSAFWWKSLALQLGPNDSVHFSVDGDNHESNIKYRVNSDFNSITLGMKTLRAHSKCQMVWAAIGFKFNEFRIERMKVLARVLGFDKFQLTKSTKFGSIYPSYGPDDPLEPPAKLISSGLRFEREITDFTNRTTPIWPINHELYKASTVSNSVRPMCSIGNKGLYISAQGNFFPCCWVANRYEHNKEWQTLGAKFNLHQHNLETVLQDPFWSTEFQQFGWTECQTKCVAKVVSEEYASQW